MQTHLKDLQRFHRHRMPAPEVILWQKIRMNQLGIRFRRQYTFGNRIFDFYAPTIRLGIEIDGYTHFKDPTLRTRELENDERLLSEHHIHMLRFQNNEVMKNLNGVVDRIIETVASIRSIPHLNPPPASQREENRL